MNTTNFQLYLNREGHSPRTITAYMSYIGEFFVVTGAEDVVTKESIDKYKDHLAKAKLQVKTKNLKLVALRKFVAFLNREGVMNIPSPSDVHLFRDVNDRKQLDLPSREDMKSFLEYKPEERDHFIVNLLYYTGLRVSELTSLDIDKVSPEFYISGKGGKRRKVFIPPALMKEIELERQTRPTGPLIVGKFGERLSPRGVQIMVKKRADKHGLAGKVTPHTLRHLFATHLYESSSDLRVVQEALGHTSIATTQIYAHVSVERMRDAIKKLYN